MKKKTVKLVSAVVVLGVACGAYVGVNSYVSSQEAKEAEKEDKSVDLVKLKADDVTAVSFKADDADVEFDRKDLKLYIVDKKKMIHGQKNQMQIFR